MSTTKNIAWTTGTGNITVTYDGDGSGTITVSSDANNLHSDRSQSFTVRTTDGAVSRTVSISQVAKPYIDLSTAVVTAATQTYSGSALTPTPTVTLDGSTVPSTGYDVTYSNNTNAGTATITITGKGDYTGTATGSFTINKASRTLSFSDVYNVVVPNGTITKTATPSAGSGDGAVTYSIAATSVATVNSSTGAVTAGNSDGNTTVTATVAEGTNYLSATASYTLYVFATVHDFGYTGTVQDILLPPGSYTMQVWGAQGGSNAADSDYSIVAKEGGKGGYSTGVLSLTQEQTVYAFVGGQGASSGNGGWNCGGGNSTGSSENTSTSGDVTTYGTSRYACGGGATDIALVTSDMTYSSGHVNNRTDFSLLSRMIVAGGGSGGAMCLIRTTEPVTITDRSVADGVLTDTDYYGDSYSSGVLTLADGWDYEGYEVVDASVSGEVMIFSDTCSYSEGLFTIDNEGIYDNDVLTVSSFYDLLTLDVEHTEQEVTNRWNFHTGYAGGGANGKGYSSSYYGKQDAPGNKGYFGFGARMSVTAQKYAAGCGGAGWYGGGCDYDNRTSNYVQRSGGGSGWVNIAANASYRPSGYDALELDSGSTYDGTQTFAAPAGGTETGHAGNGYARITRN